MESPEVITFSDDFDSACSTPFVSAPSSPGCTTSHHPTGFFYSAPASPIHYMISSSSSKPKKGSVTSPEQPSGPFQFETETQTFTSGSTMTSADELFFNGQIRPMKLSSHLQRPQVLSPLLDIHNENENENENDEDDDDDVTEEPVRGRDYRSKSLRRRARSMSPLRTNTAAFEWLEEEFEQEGTHQQLEAQEDKINDNNNNSNNNNNSSNKTKLSEMETTPSGASSRSSSVGRSSKRWVFLKEFLYRSKSEGRTSTSTGTSSSHGSNNNTNNIKFWTSLSFSPNKEKEVKGKGKVSGEGNVGAKKAVNGVSNRRLGRSARSAHEVHYTLNRAQSEEMRRKTYLPYKQGLLGCLGFSSKSYGAMNGFARALNPVSSR